MKWPGETKRQKLWSEGAQTEGVVVKLWWHSRLQGTYGIEFRVKFRDGSTADVKERFLDASNQGYVSEGDVVPVRYDPSDYSKVRLDVPALEAPLKGAEAAQDARRDAALARLGEPGAGAGVEGLTPMAKGMEVKAQQDRMVAANPGGIGNLSSDSPGRSGSDPEDRLAKLADLKERGVLSDEEFAAEKAKILAES
jgi:putative oligomerization/nucleic acid binding protein